jgi:D-3-phosphoglycerate dehydrogenase
MENSDIISVHLNMTNENADLVNMRRLKKMKPSSIIINTSRGEIINEHDLELAVKNGIIAGAGLDVFKEEPYYGPLTNYENVILTPHIGSYAKEIRMVMELEAVNNLIKGLNI